MVLSVVTDGGAGVRKKRNSNQFGEELGRIQIVYVDEQGQELPLLVYRMRKPEPSEQVVFGRVNTDGQDKRRKFLILVFASEDDRKRSGFGPDYFGPFCRIDPVTVSRLHAK